MNFIERLKIKLLVNDWEEYGMLKTSRIAKKRRETYRPPLFTNTKGPISFKHSGNSGDIIYALPFAKGISENVGLNLYFNLDQPAEYDKNFEHPLGRVMLNEKMMNMLKPLMLAQEGIHFCEQYDNQPIDIDLDLVRSAPIPFTKMSLPRWYFIVFGASYDLSKPWLKADPDSSSNNYITVARSNRYHGHNINYTFLRKYPKVQFVGVKNEYMEMKKMIPGLEYRPVNNFLEMASIISGSRLFIGNQSFPFSLAEGLKANRLLEVSTLCPDVSISGENGNEFLFQSHFESLVKQLY